MSDTMSKVYKRRDGTMHVSVWVLLLIMRHENSVATFENSAVFRSRPMTLGIPLIQHG